MGGINQTAQNVTFQATKNNRIQLLDCTLRDGGYVNNWEFSRELYEAVPYCLQQAHLDFIELGIMGSGSKGFTTKFETLEDIPLPKRLENSNSLFTVMMTGKEYERITVAPYQKDKTLDAIRYAFFKADKEKGIIHLRKLVDKGYKVFAQTMATFQYSDDELLELVDDINKIKPYAFYIVDSFGTLYPKDIKHLYHLVADVLDDAVIFGIHTHNNLQMANANAITFLEESQGRNVIVDGSIYGMGRGAGNAQTEVLMKYLNENCAERCGAKPGEAKYDIDEVWKLYNDFFAALRAQYEWGYLPDQYLVAQHEINPSKISIC